MNDLISGDFGDVFRALCEHYREEYLVIATFRIGGDRELADGRLLPILKLRAEGLSGDSYWNAIHMEPGRLRPPTPPRKESFTGIDDIGGPVGRGGDEVSVARLKD